MLKILLNIVETLVPVAGELVENVKSKDGGVGRFFAPRFIKQIEPLKSQIVVYK